jgi:hypothetical protein
MSRAYASLTTRIMLLSFLAVLSCVAPALADLVTWRVDVTLTDGGPVTGYFNYDTGALEITSWSITVHPADASLSSLVGVTNPFTFTPADFGDADTGKVGAYVEAGFSVILPTELGPQETTYVLLLFLPFDTDFGVAGSVPCTRGVYSIQTWVGTEPYYDMNYVSSGYVEILVDHGSVSAVPLPPTILLLGSALVGLAGWRRFRKG